LGAYLQLKRRGGIALFVIIFIKEMSLATSIGLRFICASKY